MENTNKWHATSILIYICRRVSITTSAVEKNKYRFIAVLTETVAKKLFRFSVRISGFWITLTDKAINSIEPLRCSGLYAACMLSQYYDRRYFCTHGSACHVDCSFKSRSHSHCIPYTFHHLEIQSQKESWMFKCCISNAFFIICN